MKMNGKVSWKDTEITKACKLLDLETNFIHLYFFKEKVHVCEQR
ncbi:repressor [Enterococcus faecalis]|nr:repressor [Enterococcus faecalis]OSH38645.1 repressor [Enterococcus faecalis]